MKKKIMILLLAMSMTMAACKSEPTELKDENKVVVEDVKGEESSPDDKTWEDSIEKNKKDKDEVKIDGTNYVDGAFIETTKNLINPEPRERTFGEGIKNNEPAINFTAKTYDGDDVTLNELLQDGKMNVLSFFFST